MEHNYQRALRGREERMKRNLVSKRGCTTFFLSCMDDGEYQVEISPRLTPLPILGISSYPVPIWSLIGRFTKGYLKSRSFNIYGGSLPVVDAVSKLNRGVTFHATAIAKAYIRQGLINLKNAVCNAWAVVMYEQTSWRWKNFKFNIKKYVDSDRTRTCARERN